MAKPKQLFTFQSDAVDADTFMAVRFDGLEALSALFRFDIYLLAERPDIDLAELLRHSATLTLHGEEAGDVQYHGILSRCTLEHPVGKRFLYQVQLVPLCWRLTLIEHNQVFLNRTVPQMLDTILRDGDLTPADFDFRLQSEYESREYACQYRESHYNFMSRRMEQNGIYTFFEHRSGRDSLVITDTLISHEEPQKGGQLVYVPDSGLDGISKTKSVQRFTKVHNQVSGSVHLRDYNYRKPSLEMSGEAQISKNGFGNVYHYGDHFQSREQGQRLAAIRAEEQRWQEQLFQGESTAVGLQPGFLFSLSNHFREDLNRHYLCVDIEHHGRQGEDFQEPDGNGESWYRNSFTAIPSDIQFRPKRTTPKPSFSGTINARIDGQGSGEYAELDEQGRYKVVLPFDISGRTGGKASTWLRMMQPFTGQGYGMHFPLRKGSEVLLTFVDANPDRPIISGAVPNPETRSVVEAGNQDRSGFQTAGGSSFYSDDRQGHQHIMFKAGDDQSGLRIGAGSDSSVAAWSSNLFMGGTAMSVIGSLMANYTFAAIQDTSITGWKFGLIMKVLEKFMMRAPKIIEQYDRANTDADPNVIQNEVDLVTAVSSIVEILVELYFIALTVTEMGDEDKAGNSAFIVYSKDGETLVRNRASGEHIYFNTETGNIYGEAKSIELESGSDEEEYIQLGSGVSDDDTDTRATVELMQGNITITSGNLGNPGEDDSEDSDSTDDTEDTEDTTTTDTSEDTEETEESTTVEPSGNAPPTDDGKNYVKIVSGLSDDDVDAQASLELMQGDMVLTSGNNSTSGEENSIWLLSGSEDASTRATAQFSQGDIEMVSGEGDDNYIQFVSGASDADNGQAIVQVKQGTVTIQSGDAQVIISNGEITLSGDITIDGASEGNLEVDSDSKIILG
ncbi:MAG: type VI secretion system tip protein TssI/VgrG [Candidatus Electrothrix scaldis]|nr:MAG: type VI secretion system tip protein TssI/VgrG [Candidatus Electrothrix sp. GW3-3]